MKNGCLIHHGIKGMHWGEWNEETRRRRMGGGRSTTIKKGSTFKRITGTERNVDLSRPLYVSDNRKDLKEYRKLAMFLPSVSKIDKAKKIYSEVTLKAKDDIVVAEGKTVVDYVMKKHGNMTYTQLKDQYPSGAGLTSVGKFMARNKKLRDVPISELYEKAERRKQVAIGKMYIHDLMSHGVGSFAAKDKSKRNKMIGDFKRWGYDAIVDPEDYTSTISKVNVDHPLLILEPSNTVQVTKRVNKKFNEGD